MSRKRKRRDGVTVVPDPMRGFIVLPGFGWHFPRIKTMKKWLTRKR